MKKILNYISFLLIGIMLFASCTKEEDATALAIISNTVTNGPLANEGIIQLTSSNFTASVEDDWCSLEIENDKIIVRTTQNEEKVNRSTLIHIVPTQGEDKIIVPITQRGLLFEVNSPTNQLSYSLKGGVKKINIISNVEYNVEFDEDWMSYEINGDTLYLKAEPLQGVSDPNFMRQAHVKVNYGVNNVDFNVSQYTIYDYSELLGDAYLSFIDGGSLDESKRVRIPVKLTAKQDGRIFTVTTAPLAHMQNFPVKFDININPDNTLEITTGQTVVAGYSDPVNTTVKNIFLTAYNVNAKAFCPNFGVFNKASAKIENGYVTYQFKPYDQFNNNALLQALMKYYDSDGLVVAAYSTATMMASGRVSKVAPYLYMMDLRLEK